MIAMGDLAGAGLRSDLSERERSDLWIDPPRLFLKFVPYGGHSVGCYLNNAKGEQMRTLLSMAAKSAT